MSSQPTTLLIAALGGEGGGVLADWIVDCATRAGLPVQATSVPGVAQGTGSTSYYLEFLREPAPAGAEPVFGLLPLAGRVDVVVASELLEAARMIERGFVTPQRTTLVTARHRVLTTVEKMPVVDGRFDAGRLHAAASKLAKRCLSLDLQQIAERHGTVISAVMFGALAGSGALPWPRALCEQVIRDGGIGVATSLAGFAEAFDTAAADGAPTPPAKPAAPTLAETLARGAERLADYQDARLAAEYRARIAALQAAAPQAADATLAEAARALALWWSYEDVMRVAELKTRRERLERVRDEARAGAADLIEIREHFHPGVEEIAAVLPRRLGLALRARAKREAPIGTRGAGRTLQTTSVHGFVLLKLLASLKGWRRRSLRWHEERAAADAWLAALEHALPRHAAFAAALAGLPRLRKGYSDTFQRGAGRYDEIFDRLVRPLVDARRAPTDADAEALAQAIAAALAQPESPPAAPKAQPIVFHPRDSTRASRPASRPH